MSPARSDVNGMIDYLASLSDSFDKTLFVGVDSRWDYRHLFDNYETLDINPKTNPNIVADIQDTKIHDKYDRIIFTGVYEYLEKPQKAMEEIYRLLADDGIALICVPCPGFYKDKPTVEPASIFKVLRLFKIREILITWYRGVPSYIHCICNK